MSDEAKKKLYNRAKLAWHGFKLFAGKTESFLDGTPFKIPVGVLNTLIGISDVSQICMTLYRSHKSPPHSQNVIDNRETMSNLLISIHNRFEIIAGSILESGQYPRDTQTTCGNFAKCVAAL